MSISAKHIYILLALLTPNSGYHGKKLTESAISIVTKTISNVPAMLNPLCTVVTCNLGITHVPTDRSVRQK